MTGWSKIMTKIIKIAVVGSGPAGLMCASVLSAAKLSSGATLEVHLFEQRAALARKILIAGSSGLNVSYDASVDEFASHLKMQNLATSATGATTAVPLVLTEHFKQFFWNEWCDFLQATLHCETFLGTSQRYFVKEMHAANLVMNWKKLLVDRGVVFHLNSKLQNLAIKDNGNVQLMMQPEGTLHAMEFSAAGLFLGGGSWEEQEVQWPKIFKEKNINFLDFKSCNAGFCLDWKAAFLKEAQQLPLKNIKLKTALGEKIGDLLVTAYGLEGTPIYFYGTPGEAELDLYPVKSEAALLDLLQKKAMVKKMAPLRLVQKYLSLCPAAKSLLFHETSENEKKTLPSLVKKIKHFKIVLKSARPLPEAISSQGGIAWEEVDEYLMLRKMPHVFVGGEMLNWHAPTGGFLIQTCVTQGYIAAQGILRAVANLP